MLAFRLYRISNTVVTLTFMDLIVGSSELNLPCFDQLREKSHKISPSEAGMGSWLFKWTYGNHGNREPTLPDWDFVEIM